MAFNLKKEEIRRRMQELDHELNAAKPEQAAVVDGKDIMPSWLEPLSGRSGSGMSAAGRADESGPAVATCGTTLQIKVRRPTRNSLGFRVVGGVDRAYGGVFIDKISSSTATELKVSDPPVSLSDPLAANPLRRPEISSFPHSTCYRCRSH